MNPYLVLKPIGEVYGTTIGVTITSLPSIPSAAAKALIQVETAAIRARFDGTISVTNGVGGGMLLNAGSDYVFEGWDALYRMRMVGNTTVSAKINVVYYGEAQIP